MSVDRVSDILTFIRTAEAGSFTLAGQRLGLGRSAVGKRIARLEDRLGARLLHRTTRAVSLTEEGSRFFDRCTTILAELDAAEAEATARDATPKGILRIDLPVSLGRLHVLPVLHDFLRQWPELAAHITFSDRYVDLIEEGIDLALRIGGATDSTLKARTLAQHRRITCASPGYLERQGVPRTLEALEQHDCISFTHGGRASVWLFRNDAVPLRLAVNGRLRVDNAEALRDATVAGQGIGQLATFLIGDELKSGRLVEILAPFATPGEPIRAIYPSARHLSPRVRSFIDVLAAAWSPAPPWDIR
jgi:DNA-binding transcriptional LysR family regulator